MIAQVLEDAWSSGRLRVWRNDQLMLRHDMLACYVRITVDADGRGWTCGVEQRPGTVIGVQTTSGIRYDNDKGAVITIKKPRWEFDRADVEALLASPGNDHKRGPKALKRTIAEICPNYEALGTGAVMKQVGEWLQNQNKPVPSRDRFERAMGRRK